MVWWKCLGLGWQCACTFHSQHGPAMLSVSAALLVCMYLFGPLARFLQSHKATCRHMFAPHKRHKPALASSSRSFSSLVMARQGIRHLAPGLLNVQLTSAGKEAAEVQRVRLQTPKGLHRQRIKQRRGVPCAFIRASHFA